MAVFDGDIDFRSVYMFDYTNKSRPFKMAVFDGDIDFRSVYMFDYTNKSRPPDPRAHVKDDDCLIIGATRDALKSRNKPVKIPDVLCPLNPEYYKEAVQRFAKEHPKLTERYMSKDIDPTPLDHIAQDRARTEYLVQYCSRDMPFMSVNLTRRAKALQTLRLPDDIEIPETVNRLSYRHPPENRYEEHPSKQCLRPKYDKKLHVELTRILRVRTGESNYQASHGLLGRVILDNNPFGKPRKEPRYGRWKTPYFYTYYL